MFARLVMFVLRDIRISDLAGSVATKDSVLAHAARIAMGIFIVFSNFLFARAREWQNAMPAASAIPTSVCT